MVHTWTMGSFIVYTRIRLLLHVRLFIYLFFFISNFQTLKFFFTLFSGTVRPRRLKLGTHVDSGQMHCVYWNQAAAVFRPFISSFFFLSNFQTLKFFVTLFSGTVRPKRLKLVTHVKNGGCSYSPLYFFIFLCLQFSNIKDFRYTFLRNCEAWKIETWYMHG